MVGCLNVVKKHLLKILVENWICFHFYFSGNFIILLLSGIFFELSSLFIPEAFTEQLLWAKWYVGC